MSFLYHCSQTGVPAIVFSAVYFFRLSFELIRVVSSLGCLACWQVLHIDRYDRQVGFVGYNFFDGSILLAIVS
jgi:hypothetical protein